MNAKVSDPDKIPFSVLVTLLDKISSGKAAQKKDLFRTFLEKFNPGTEYPVLRLIFPEADSARGAYGLKEHSIGRTFADLLILPPHEKDRVLKWKDPSAQAKHNCTPGDFPSVLLSAIEPRMSSKRTETLSVGDVNKMLDDLYISIDADRRKEIFQEMIYKASPREIRWIMRMVLKDMKLGIGAEAILRHLHPNAVQLYHMSSSLKHVLEAIAKPASAVTEDGGVDKISTIYFQPFKPMLSERVNPGDIPERFGHIYDGIFLEPKLDGERMLIHVDKRSGRVTIYSRNGVNFTKKYGDHQLSPILLTAVKGTGAVFDGELVAWDQRKQRIHPFGYNREISKSATSSISESQDSQTDLGVSEDGNLFYIIFDLVFYIDLDNNEFDLRNTELSSRRDLLERILIPVEHRVELIKHKFVRQPSVDDIKVYLKAALDKKQEGIIVKRGSSNYKLNVRGSGWYKIKADYDTTFTDTLDLVVLGGYFSDTVTVAEPHAASPLDAVTSFLVGVAKNSEENGMTEFKTVTKVSTGLTQTQLVFLRNQLRSSVIHVQPGQLPDWFGEWKPAKADRPDVFFNPFMKESSVVLEVNAGEILQSACFSSGYQLRFPRIVRPRADKDWTDATSLDDLRTMATVDRDNDRVFIQNLSRFERGFQPPPTPKEPKRRKKEIVIIEAAANSQPAPKEETVNDTLHQVTDDEW